MALQSSGMIAACEFRVAASVVVCKGALCSFWQLAITIAKLAIHIKLRMFFLIVFCISIFVFLAYSGQDFRHTPLNNRVVYRRILIEMKNRLS